MYLLLFPDYISTSVYMKVGALSSLSPTLIISKRKKMRRWSIARLVWRKLLQETHTYLHVKSNLVFQFCSVTQSNDKIQVAMHHMMAKHNYSSILPENCNFIWKHMGYVSYVEYYMISTSHLFACHPQCFFSFFTGHQHTIQLVGHPWIPVIPVVQASRHGPCLVKKPGCSWVNHNVNHPFLWTIYTIAMSYCIYIYYHLVMTNSLPWKIHPFWIGKPSISMGHLYHGYVK